MLGRDGDEQIKGLVPTWIQRLFHRGRRCDVHVVHAQVGDGIGQAEHVPFDETMRGNDCPRLFVSDSRSTLRGPRRQRATGQSLKGRTSQFDRVRPRFPPRNRQQTSHDAPRTLLVLLTATKRPFPTSASSGVKWSESKYHSKRRQAMLHTRHSTRQLHDHIHHHIPLSFHNSTYVPPFHPPVSTFNVIIAIYVYIYI